MFSYSSGELRKVITTPGGHKRKVKPSHATFKFELKDALSALVREKVGSFIMADELINSLHKYYPASKHIDRTKILRTATEVFGKRLERKGSKKMGFYSDLAFKEDLGGSTTVLDCENEAVLYMSPASKSAVEESRLQFSDSDSITECSTSMVQPRSCKGRLQFSDALESEPIQEKEPTIAELKAKIKDLETKVEELQKSGTALVNSQAELTEMYKGLLDDGGQLGGTLTLTERNKIKKEITKVKEHFNLGLRKNEVTDLCDVIRPLLFAELVDKVKLSCPTISNILEQLVLSRNASRNVRKTETVKMKAAIHLLSSMMDVRDQTGHNDVQLLFGLLCVSYGAKSSLIEVLQHIGLTESYPVICSTLKKQLDHYKEIIKQRVAPDCPVVTYQDNMQLQRTSMRHLRLSKLQKDKKKQEKVWDFTVRGWRSADISGIEELFLDPTTAKDSQRNVSELTFDDLNIECHKEQHEKWVEFKERNLLRKMKKAFCHVPLSSDELKNATSEQLKDLGCKENEEMTSEICISVPPVPDDFKNRELTKSQIYPLPISIENQCTTLGTASNLDKFQEEFHFVKNNVSKFLPLKKGTREYNLESAYDRYSFLKSMDIHKREQADYEQFLRKIPE